MLSRDANYNMDTALNEINEKKLLLDIKVETQLILQLLVQKGIVTREEVSEMRNKVKNSPNYKPLYDYFEQAEQKANYYKNNPEQHLKDIELKPCPFCGGIAYISLHPFNHPHIDCHHSKKCKMRSDTWLLSALPLKKQIKAWNMRSD